MGWDLTLHGKKLVRYTSFLVYLQPPLSFILETVHLISKKDGTLGIFKISDSIFQTKVIGVDAIDLDLLYFHDRK